MDTNLIRALLTDSYAPINNGEILDMIDPYIEDSSDVKWDYQTDDILNISITFPKTNTELKVGDVVQTGIHIRNSEVGISSAAVLPFVHRLVCTNGMTRYEGGSGGGKFRHIGNAEMLKSRIKGFIESAFLESTTIVAQFRESLHRAIPDPTIYMENLAKDKNLGLTQEAFKHMLQNFSLEPDHNLFGVVNAITRTANLNYAGESRFDLERLSTKVLAQGLHN
jgi:hypothetical protein